MHINSNFQETIINNWGKEGKKWFESLPLIAEKVAKEWNITEITPIDSLSYNYVLTGYSNNIAVVIKIGFDQKDSEQIFSIFKRLHFNSEFEGTGIGLAICKKITDQHNGFISARSKINEGSTFIISLPATSPLN